MYSHTYAAFSTTCLRSHALLLACTHCTTAQPGRTGPLRTAGREPGHERKRTNVENKRLRANIYIYIYIQTCNSYVSMRVVYALQAVLGLTSTARLCRPWCEFEFEPDDDKGGVVSIFSLLPGLAFWLCNVWSQNWNRALLLSLLCSVVLCCVRPRPSLKQRAIRVLNRLGLTRLGSGLIERLKQGTCGLRA